ncbi:hypothetical protein R3P38DRAFT_3190752 [Favolaschia claudopus]|uniref:BZIP domain-containing protein n=1 Tax=Favolaschia claudopus TaxID=2862362 RepID=A0AAW0BP30_9AGAR
MAKRGNCDPRTRNADANWEYRKRNQTAINERAKLRMRRKRDQLRNAPEAIRQENARRTREQQRICRLYVPFYLINSNSPRQESSRRAQARKSTLTEKKISRVLEVPPITRATRPTATTVYPPRAIPTTHKHDGYEAEDESEVESANISFADGHGPYLSTPYLWVSGGRQYFL